MQIGGQAMNSGSQAVGRINQAAPSKIALTALQTGCNNRKFWNLIALPERAIIRHDVVMMGFMCIENQCVMIL
jgi:hypothetical protein